MKLGLHRSLAVSLRLPNCCLMTPSLCYISPFLTLLITFNTAAPLCWRVARGAGAFGSRWLSTATWKTLLIWRRTAAQNRTFAFGYAHTAAESIQTHFLPFLRLHIGHNFDLLSSIWTAWSSICSMAWVYCTNAAYMQLQPTSRTAWLTECQSIAVPPISIWAFSQSEAHIRGMRRNKIWFNFFSYGNYALVLAPRVPF